MTCTGLNINCRKTNLLSLTGSVNRNVKVAGVQIEAVDRFAYIGSIKDIENRSIWNVISSMTKQQV